MRPYSGLMEASPVAILNHFTKPSSPSGAFVNPIATRTLLCLTKITAVSGHLLHKAMVPLVCLLVCCGLALPAALADTPPKKKSAAAEKAPVPCAEVATATIEEQTDRYTIKVAYPAIGAALVDEDIARWARDQAERFRMGMVEIPASDPSHFALTISFEVSQPSLRCISYIFKVETSTANEVPETGLLTFTYHIQEGNRLEITDLFHSQDGLLDFFSSFSRKNLLFREWLDANSTYVAPGTRPESVNFSTFAVTSTGITLYFPPKQVAPAIEGCVSLPVPMRELFIFSPHLSLWEGCVLPRQEDPPAP